MYDYNNNLSRTPVRSSMFVDRNGALNDIIDDFDVLSLAKDIRETMDSTRRIDRNIMIFGPLITVGLGVIGVALIMKKKS